MKSEDQQIHIESDNSEKFAFAENGMVSTAFPDATDAGVQILKEGGNAIDAACSAAFALSVCEPQASGLGGQTMMLVYTGKTVIAIDGSSRAPSLAHVNSIYKDDRSVGYRSQYASNTLLCSATLWQASLAKNPGTCNPDCKRGISNHQASELVTRTGNQNFSQG